MKNKIKDKIIHKAKCVTCGRGKNDSPYCSNPIHFAEPNWIATAAKHLRTWLTQPATVSWARPFKRDTHLNSVKAISIYLAMVDRPITLAHSDTKADWGGASREEKD